MRIITFTVILVLLFSIPLQAEWMDEDKVLHYSAGAFVYSVADTLELDSPMKWVLLAGVSKELADHLFLDGSVRIGDIHATLMGGITAKYIIEF